MSSKKKSSDKLKTRLAVLKKDDPQQDLATQLLNENIDFPSEVVKSSVPPAADEGDKTVVSGSHEPVARLEKTEQVSAGDNSTHRNISTPPVTKEEKISYGEVREENLGEYSEVSNYSVDSILKQSDSLRAAQEKINDLEKEIEDLRRENDELLTSADTFKTLSEDYFSQIEKFKSELHEIKEVSRQEVNILKEALSVKDRQANEFKQANLDLKSKIEDNFNNIRKRERDLEYRLEIAKVEETALLKSKDKTILDLRRKNDKTLHDMEAYREKSKEHYQKLQDQQNTVRSVVRALRIALTRLEGDFGVDLNVIKKAE